MIWTPDSATSPFECRPSGVLVPARPKPDYPTAFDLFAGAGGFSLGFHAAGFHVVGALEWDVHAAMTYLVNLGSPETRLYFPDPAKRAKFDRALKHLDGVVRQGKKSMAWTEHPPLVDHGDYCTWPAAGGNGHFATGRHPEGGCWEPALVLWIADAKKVAGADILASLGMERLELDAVMGGPPCQGFSMAGRRNVYDERNSLVFDFMRIVCDLQPKTFVMENVPGLVSMVTSQGELVVDALCRMAEEGGMGAADNLRQMLETTAGVGIAHRSVRRKGDLKLDDGEDGESRSERRRRLAAERKRIKADTKQSVVATRSGEVLVQDALFAEVGS